MISSRRQRNMKSLLLFLSVLAMMYNSVQACSSCLISSTVGAAGFNTLANKRQSKQYLHQNHNLSSNAKSGFMFLAFQKLASNMSSFRGEAFSIEKDDEEKKREFDEILAEAKKRERLQEEESLEEKSSKVVSAGMVGAIGFYKNFISPLLPPACRFLPTCSQYGVQAIEEFGPEKGLILTAWRLMRCSPFGGRGYDPPKWPPVAYNYGSY